MSGRGIDLRSGVLALLGAVYVGVSAIAYTDYPRADRGPTLSPLETRGLAVWRTHNCQVCHQLHGLGGFLGPDLTNRVDPQTPDAQLAHLLDEGAGPMPPLRLSADEQHAVLSYLRAMGQTGRAQPQPLAEGQRFSWATVPWFEYP